MPTRRAIVVAMLVVAGACLSILAAVAAGCSCAVQDPRRALAESDAALVGTLLERREAPAGPSGSALSGQMVTLRFRAADVIKGPLTGEVEVTTSRNGGTCGVEVAVGETIGLFLYREAGGWRSSLCQQVAPDVLRRAREPLPRPTGRGPVVLLLAGTYGPANIVALDRSGRVLGYGAGRGLPLAVSVCPGSRRAVELTTSRSARQSIVVRDLSTLRVVRRWAVGPRHASAMVCRDRDARDVVVNLGFALARTGPRGLAVIHRWRPNVEARLDRSRAYAIVGRSVVAVDLDTGGQRAVAIAPSGLLDVVPSPDGRHFAGLVVTHGRPGSRATLVLTGRAGVRRIRLARIAFFAPTWLDDRQVALIEPVSAAAHPVYDPSGRLVGRLPGVRGFSPVRVGDDLYTLTSTGPRGTAVQVRRRRLSGGRGTALATLDTPGLSLLVGVAGGPEVRGGTATPAGPGAAAAGRPPGLRCPG